jgi:lipid-A-disaccharide synthase
MANSRLRIVVTVNGPGEVSGWLYPFALAAKRRFPQVEIVAAVLPCVYASGMEAAVLRRGGFVDAVWDFSAALRTILNGPSSNGAASPPTCLIHMGGEPILSLALGRRLKGPVFAYAESPIALQGRFDQIFWADREPLHNPFFHLNLFPDKRASARPAKNPGKRLVVGNLMVDSAALQYSRAAQDIDKGLCIGIFPGSRPYQFANMVPFYLEVARKLIQPYPGAEVLLAKADFISLSLVEQMCAASPGLMGGEKCCFIPASGQGREMGFVEAQGGFKVKVCTAGQVMERAHLALTVPGTNTAQLAALGIPMVVAVPTFHAHMHPLPGIMGFLSKIPGAGRYLKEKAAFAYLKTWPFTAHPNIRAGRDVVPEVLGAINAQDVLKAARSLLENGMEKTCKDLREVMGEPGAAERLTEALLNACREHEILTDF